MMRDRLRPIGPAGAVAAAGLCFCLGLAGCGGSGSGAAAPTTTVKSTVVHLGSTPVAPATTIGPNLPDIGMADQAACDSDFKTIRAAESSYQLLNGSYTTISDLVAQQFLRTASAYYVGIKIGTPVGGYTLIAAPHGPCVSLPVRDAA